jgi:sRNA-binding protein
MARLKAAGLLEPWPPCLPTEPGRPPMPLAIGITAALRALVAPGIDPGQVDRLLRFYTRTAACQRALAARGARRHRVDGQPDEDVSDQHRECAERHLAGLVARQRGERP